MSLETFNQEDLFSEENASKINLGAVGYVGRSKAEIMNRFLDNKNPCVLEKIVKEKYRKNGEAFKVKFISCYWKYFYKLSDSLNEYYEAHPDSKPKKLEMDMDDIEEYSEKTLNKLLSQNEYVASNDYNKLVSSFSKVIMSTYKATLKVMENFDDKI